VHEVTRDHGLRRISRLAFRGLIATFITVVVAGALYWVWTTVEDRRLERIVSQTQVWESQKTPLIATLKTRCSNSRLYYKLVIHNTFYANPDVDALADSILSPNADDDVLKLADESFPEGFRPLTPEEKKQLGAKVKNAFRQLKKSDLNLEFYDPDGFKVVEVIVKSNKLTKVVEDNEIIRLEANASTFCYRRAYAQAATWELSQTTYK